MQAVARRAAIARSDLPTFFEFVLREETTRDRIRCLAHQRVVFAFVEAHPYCVVRLPVGFSKTYLSSGIALHLLGQDPTLRGIIASAASEQAQKPLGMVASYIDGAESPELRAVFPLLRRTQRSKERWTRQAITVDRPPGIRDASLAAVGVESRVLGARLNFFVIDDCLDEQTTRTEESRKALRRWFARTILSRRDPKASRVIVLNTPWHEKDLTYSLEEEGWPSLTMDALGGVYLRKTEWDSPLLRPSISGRPEDERGPQLRLVEHDAEKFGAPLCVVLPGGGVRRLRADEVVPAGTRFRHVDLDDEVPLWPGKFSLDVLRDLFDTLSPVEVNQQYMMRVRDEESAHCRVEWVEECKRIARLAGVETFAQEARGSETVVTGVDLGIGLKKENDYSAFFTAALIPSLEVLVPGQGLRVLRNVRRVLDVEIGRWSGAELVDRVILKAQRFNSIVAVESNAAQRWIREWALERNRAIPVVDFPTGLNKLSRAHGVSSLFLEVQNSAWLFPNRGGRCPKPLEEAIQAALYYRPPPAHTDDVLMAWWICREKLREIGQGGGGHFPGASVGARLAMR